MTAAEMNLDQLNQICRLQADELESKDSQIRRIRDTVAIHKQNHSDTMVMTHDQKKKAEEQCAWKALDNIEKEIEAIIGQEG
ncbi:hypothetical protein SAMN05443270_1086 [Lacrimispora sphenoides]|uniref:hypothetical protein n=1 Tax=Lacrimispora sphenoides TaxID=29370 RepID=UPI0008B9F41B|nr:hypothetical protein [Lacrimispora sphenoides]SET71436.1 hypothetical protein SAMN05443270_1086 [Lacrimispora sphenoides]